MNFPSTKPLAVVTGASTGIGYELARIGAIKGYDLIIAADEFEIVNAGGRLRDHGAQVRVVQTDLARREGVESLYQSISEDGRPVDLLMANAGRGLGHAFLDQDFKDAQYVLDTNITGTLCLLHLVGKDMRARGKGKILITGSIAGFLPGAYSAVYNGTKAFLNNFSFALRNELKDSGVTVTYLMPGATDTAFFVRAGLMDTKVGQSPKDDPAEVAKVGFEAMMDGEGDVVSGWKNKVQSAIANVLPSDMLAEQHRKMNEPGSAPAE